MSVVRPFRGVRYNLEKVLLRQVIAPPYDVISQEMRNSLVTKSSYNVVRVDLPEGEASEKYGNASRLYKEWLKDGILKKDREPGYYLYEQVYKYDGKDYVRTGFVGLLRLEELGEGKVFAHEKTHAGPKQDRFELMKSCETNFSQLFGLYMDSENYLSGLSSEIKKDMPVASAVDDEGVKNSVWFINKEELVNKITTFMKNKSVYIADGHHRYETALTYRNYMRDFNKDSEGELKPYDFVMMMFVNFYDEGLKIFPTHRVVDVPEGFSIEQFLKSACEKFEIIPFDDLDGMRNSVEETSAETKGYWGVSYGGRYFCMKLKEASVEGEHPIYRRVDTHLLQNIVLQQMLGLSEEKISRKENIYFYQTYESVEKSVSSHDRIGFYLRGMDIDVVREVSEANMVMPQKSTYFYPKLETGLIINDL